MRVVVETQSRVRARRRTRAKQALLRALRSLAGMPAAPTRHTVTFRRVSRLRTTMQQMVPGPLIEDRQVRAMALGLVLGVAHVAFALVNIVFGLLSRSVWTLSVGAMVAGLNIGKSYLASGALTGGALGNGPETTASLRRCRAAGIALALMVPVMSGTIVRLVVRGYGGASSGTLLYGYALYAFIQVTVALINLFRARRAELLAIKGVRAFNLAVALISIFALQTVVLARIRWEQVPFSPSRAVVEGVVGGLVCLSMLMLGLWLASTAARRLADRNGRVRYRRRGRARRANGAERRPSRPH